MSIVKGSHFVFAKPLLYRRYIEEAYLEQGMPTPANQPIVCPTPANPTPMIFQTPPKDEAISKKTLE
jgi:hypothetical protein